VVTLTTQVNVHEEFLAEVVDDKMSEVVGVSGVRAASEVFPSVANSEVDRDKVGSDDTTIDVDNMNATESIIVSSVFASWLPLLVQTSVLTWFVLNRMGLLLTSRSLLYWKPSCQIVPIKKIKLLLVCVLCCQPYIHVENITSLSAEDADIKPKLKVVDTQHETDSVPESAISSDESIQINLESVALADSFDSGADLSTVRADALSVGSDEVVADLSEAELVFTLEAQPVTMVSICYYNLITTCSFIPAFRFGRRNRGCWAHRRYVWHYASHGSVGVIMTMLQKLKLLRWNALTPQNSIQLLNRS
jgi:hypothetical protein